MGVPTVGTGYTLYAPTNFFCSCSVLKYFLCFWQNILLQDGVWSVEGLIIITDSLIISEITFYYFNSFFVGAKSTLSQMMEGQVGMGQTMQLRTETKDQTGMSNIGRE